MRTVITTIFATLLLAILSGIALPAAYADPPSTSRYIADDDWAGYVDVSNISMRGDTFSFVVTIDATRGAVPVNPLYFIAKADDGTTYDEPDYTYTDLHSGDLPAGERVKGIVAFGISGPRPTMIEYEAPLGEILAKWTITWRTTPQPKQPVSPFGSSS
ncbi:DUF1942 domain-containing protein [Gordonia sp. NPDC003429]